MSNYDIEAIKEDFWQKIRPKTPEEIASEEMMVKVKNHFDKLIEDLLQEDGTTSCGSGRISKAKRFTQIKEEMDDFILGLNNVK